MLLSVNPSPQKAGGGVQSSSDAGSRVKGEYPMIPEQPKEEDSKNKLKLKLLTCCFVW